MTTYTPVKEYQSRMKFKDGSAKYITISDEGRKILISYVDKYSRQLITAECPLPYGMVVCKIDENNQLETE